VSPGAVAVLDEARLAGLLVVHLWAEEEEAVAGALGELVVVVVAGVRVGGVGVGVGVGSRAGSAGGDAWGAGGASAGPRAVGDGVGVGVGADVQGVDVGPVGG